MATDTKTTVRNVTEHYGSRRTSLLLVVAGAALFLVPEPITSVLGAVLMLVGAGSWIVGRLLG